MQPIAFNAGIHYEETSINCIQRQQQPGFSLDALGPLWPQLRSWLAWLCAEGLRLDARGHVGEDVREGPRRDSAVDVVVHVAEHREGLARARLAVRHDRAVDAVHHVLHDVARERLVDRVLARVVEHVVEPEVEARLGVVADAVGTRLVALVDRDGVAVRVDGDVARRELGRRPRPNAHLDGLAHALAVGFLRGLLRAPVKVARGSQRSCLALRC